MRDSDGLVGDLFLNPVAYVEPWETSVAISTGKMTNENSFRIGNYEDFKAAGSVVSTSFVQELNVKTGTIRNNTDRLFVLASFSIFQNLIVVLIIFHYIHCI